MNIREQLIAFAAAVIAAAVPVVRAYVLTKLTPERVAHVADIARVAVRGAEEWAAGLEKLEPHAGPAFSDEKLTFAVEALHAGAARLGVHLTDGEASAFVHQALAELHTVQQLAAPPVPDTAAPAAA